VSARKTGLNISICPLTVSARAAPPRSTEKNNQQSICDARGDNPLT